MHFLSNEWVIGISTGIMSGLLVTRLLQIFIAKKKTKEYRQRIASANREIVYSIRVMIPDDALPTNAVIRALIHSTARRYGVESEELYGPKEIGEELVKEVMDSSFLSSTRKIEYCKSLESFDYETLLAEVMPASDHVLVADFSVRETLRLQRTTISKSGRLATLVLGTLTGAMTTLIYYYLYGSGVSVQLKPVLKGAVIAILPLVLMSFAVVFYGIGKRASHVAAGERELDEIPQQPIKYDS